MKWPIDVETFIEIYLQQVPSGNMTYAKVLVDALNMAYYKGMEEGKKSVILLDNQIGIM